MPARVRPTALSSGARNPAIRPETARQVDRRLMTTGQCRACRPQARKEEAAVDHLAPASSFGSYAQNRRVRWPEFRTRRINGITLVAVKLEDDGDLHLWCLT
jgi:hypothetical protein